MITLENQRRKQFTIQQSVVATEITGTTSEVELVVFTIPGNTLRINDRLELHFQLQQTGSTNSKTVRVKINGTTNTTNSFTDANESFVSGLRVFIVNDTTIGGISTSATVPYGSWWLNTATVDRTLPINISITGQLAVGTESLSHRYSRLEHYHAR
jgi:hypothetical protein